MPFKKVEVKKIVDEKKIEPEFDDAYRDVENEYKLKPKEVEANKSKKTIPKNG